MADIGASIRSRRIAAGMTQQELADASGVARYNIGKIETGRRDVDATEVVFIADALGVSPASLIPQAGGPGVLFRLHRPESAAAVQAIEWFERYAADSSRLRILERDVLAHLG